MGFEIVARDASGFPGTAIAEDAFNEGPIDGARVIEVNCGAPGGREARAVAVEIVQRKARGFWPESSVKFVSQPGFP